MIGAGIFTTSGLLMQNLKDPTLMIILWGVGGIIALAGALCYGEVGAHIPKAGGEYVYLSELFHPLLGFLSGWVSFLVGFSAPIAASAIGLSAYFYRALPAYGLLDAVSVEVQKKVLAILVILVFTVIHLRGLKLGSIIQNSFTLYKILLMTGIVTIGFLLGNGNWDHFDVREFSHGLPDWKSIALSLMWIMFAYSGWNASAYIGSEIKDPTRNLPGSLLLGTVVVTVIYVCLNVLYVFAVSPGEMEGVISIGGLTMKNLFGEMIEKVFSILIAVALLSSISAFIIIGPRVYYAMAKDGYFFKFAAQVHPKFKVPHWSIIFQAIISCVIILTGTLDQIFTYIGFALGIFPLFVIAGLIKLRIEKKSTRRIPGYPISAIVFFVVSITILILSLLERPFESGMAIGTILLGVPFYYALKKKV